MKKIVSFVILIMTTLTLTGCFGVNIGIHINSDGSGKLSYCYMIDSGVYKCMMKNEEFKKQMKKFEDYEETKRMYDDCYYVCYTKETEFANAKELNKLLTDHKQYSKFIGGDESGADVPFSSLECSGDYIRAGVAAEKEQMQDEDFSSGLISKNYTDSFFVLISVTFENEITYTNGTLSEDKKTVSWKVGIEEAYDTLLEASTKGRSVFRKDVKVPNIYPVKSGIYYRDIVNVVVSDDVAVKKVTCNNKKVALDYTLCNQGKYKIVAEDYAGNKTSKTFYIDLTAPKVSGVRNGATYFSKRKITFKDNYKVASATLNGKKVKSGTVVSKNGKYVFKVKDAAGNVKRVSFKIKKKN